MVNGPACEGSPESTASIAPLGSAAGGSPHLICGSVSMTCALGLAGGACAYEMETAPARSTVPTTARWIMARLLLGASLHRTLGRRVPGEPQVEMPADVRPLRFQDAVHHR